MNKVTSVAYIDLLSVLFVFFFVAFAIVYSVQKKHDAILGNTVSKAEFLVTMDWPDASDNDYDLWVRDPDDRTAFFRNKETKLLTLDRDDQGDGGKIFPVRREIVSFRGLKAGTYTVNVVLWNKRAAPEKARISVVKLNPFSIIEEKTVELTQTKEEVTILSFTVDETGRVIAKNHDPVKMVQDFFAEDSTK